MVAVVLEGTVRPDDRATAHVLRLPFEVPESTTRIDVAYRHDPGHVLDLGLADVQLGPFPSPEGFRGWSGGARTRVFVATDDATPGYIAGPIPAGTWYVLLGLALLDGPCSYRVEVDLSSVERDALASQEPPPRARLAGPGWLAGDLQSHTHHSDARGTLDELAAAAAARDLDFVAVTDHNTVSHHREIAARGGAGPLLIPGEEVTTYRGHANVWGADGWIDFRATDDASMARVVNVAHARGGLFSVNHPKRQPGCIGCDWELEVPTDADAFEAWQGPWPNRNWESLARYDHLLASGRRLTLVGGSDRHQPPLPESDPPEVRIGSPTTFVYAEEFSVAGILDGIRSGRACVSEDPHGPRIDVTAGGVSMGGRLPDDVPVEVMASVQNASVGDRLRWIDQTGVARTVRLDAPDVEDVWVLEAPGAFVRVELVASDGASRAQRWHDHLAEAAAGGAEVRAHIRELEKARHRPWIRCLSNPLYATSDRGAGTASARAGRGGTGSG